MRTLVVCSPVTSTLAFTAKELGATLAATKDWSRRHICIYTPATTPRSVVERNGGDARPLERDGAPEQVGRNTNYVIHAEEILASNFERLVLNEPNAPSPEVLERIRAELVRAVGR